MTDESALYSAYVSRDARFDGIFFIGVTSTGIYCRPVCTARTPRRANCRFFDSAEAAEKAAFRPCLRCRPELAPGNAPVDDARRVAHLVAHRIDEGLLDEGGGLEQLATRFGWSSRQIRRMLQRELGVSPIELVLTRRLLLAKQLLTETTLPITEVAYASGFGSLRRFNDAFRKRYAMAPTRLRRAAGSGSGTPPATLTLQLSYRPPYDWEGVLHFLELRALEGVESVRDGRYRRTVQLGAHRGWIEVRHAPAQRALLVELAHALTPALPALLGRLRGLFDLGARPDVIAERLSRDALLSESVAQVPGLRVPGAFDGFELAVRAILGQQVTVKGASTLAARLAAAFGEPLETPHAELVRLSPTAERLARAHPDEICAAGVIRPRALGIIALAQECASGRLHLDAGAEPDATIAQLVAIPGIGSWTANYIAMRALRWPDAFPSGDLVVRHRLGGASASNAEQRAERWRPWRSYAVLHLWQGSGRETKAPTG